MCTVRLEATPPPRLAAEASPPSRRSLTVPVLLAALLLSAGAVAQPGRVIAEYRLESPAVRIPFGQAEQSRQLAERFRAEAAKRFPYLTWEARATRGGNEPRLVLTVGEVPSEVCDPPEIVLQLTVERDGQSAPITRGPHQLALPCDLAWPTGSFASFADRVTREVSKLLGQLAIQEAIQTLLLSDVALIEALDPPAQDSQRVLLPLDPKQLKTSKSSELEVRFGQADGELVLRPEGAVGNATWAYVKKFWCGQDLDRGPLDPPDGRPWHDDLHLLFARCSNAKVFMTRYVPGLLPGVATTTTPSGTTLVLDPGTGGQP